MSYITDDLLTREARRVIQALGAEGAGVRVAATLTNFETETTAFKVVGGAKHATFSVPEDELQSCPLAYVSERHLQPALKRAGVL